MLVDELESLACQELKVIWVSLVSLEHPVWTVSLDLQADLVHRVIRDGWVHPAFLESREMMVPEANQVKKVLWAIKVHPESLVQSESVDPLDQRDLAEILVFLDLRARQVVMDPVVHLGRWDHLVLQDLPAHLLSECR